MIDKIYVKESFTKAAECYEEYAIFQKELADTLVARIPAGKLRGTILDIGGGTGYMSAKISEKNPSLHLCSADISHGMSIVAQSKRVVCPNLTVLTADGETLPFKDSSFDMVISNLAFQWISDLNKALAEIFRIIKKKSPFLITILADGSLPELRESYNHSFGNKGERVMMDIYPTEEAITSILKNNPIASYKIEKVRYVRYHKNALDFLKTLKSIGAKNPFPPPEGMRNAAAVKKMLDYYDQNFAADKGITATYQILFIEGIR